MSSARNHSGVRLHLESLETRTLPANLVPLRPVLDRNILSVIGNESANTIDVTLRNGRIQVLGKSFDASQVKVIVIDGKGGNDTIRVSENITARSYLYGGFGADRLYGGAGNDFLYGGHGVDQLYGRRGHDRLLGGEGNDRLDGGTGTDSGTGGTGSDTYYSVTENNNGSLSTNYSTTGDGALLREIVRLTNLERTSRGLNPLTFDSTLNTVANRYASTLHRINQFSHECSGHNTPSVGGRLDANLVEHTAYGENLYWSSIKSTAAQVVQGWMNSPGHRANILSSTFTRIGVGMAGDALKGYFFTQVFTRR